jgi:uncharacterized protein YceH (UPF0502 family)
MSETEASTPEWQPLSAKERRVVGVLVEKAKTTPNQYPLTINAIVTGGTQKSNRFPVMQLDADDVEDALDRLRGLRAIVEVQGDGRTLKYRHRMYEWLGVEKLEMAVMAELLLRGAQTLGELRGRAARMDPITDVASLRPIVDALAAKNLVVYLGPEGRGRGVTHNLYHPDELAKVCAKFGAAVSSGVAVSSPAPAAAQPPQSPAPIAAAPQDPAPSSQPIPTSSNESTAEVERLKTNVAELRQSLAELREETDRELGELRTTVEDIKQQLGI